MTDLHNQSCEACKAGAPTLTEQELTQAQAQLPNWRVEEVEGVLRFVRSFAFKDFAAAFAFAAKVGDLAEAHAHHPKLVVEWGKVEVSWWTHKIQGIHMNDAVMAAKTDSLL